MRGSRKTLRLFDDVDFPAQPKQAPDNRVAAPERPAERPATGTRLLWLCVHFPLLSLAPFASEAKGPLAVLDGQGTQRVVYACNAPAAKQGITRGLKLNAALAMAPELHTVSRDLEAEQQLLQKLAVWSQRFTSVVSIEPPGALLLEVRGSLRLFGGMQALCDKVRTGLDTLGHAPSMAAAPTATGALWLARGNNAASRSVVTCDSASLAGRLGALSLAVTGWPKKTLEQLSGMGVRSVRDALRLPRDGFARRIGKGRLQDLDRAAGRAADPRAAFAAPERFRSGYELPAEVEQIAHLSGVLEQLVRELSDYLLVRQAGVQELSLWLFHSDSPATRVSVGLMRPGREWGHLWSLLQERLEGVFPDAPVIAVRLQSGRLMTLPGRDADLFGWAGDDRCGEWPRLVESLNARLGARSVTGIGTVPEHRPELAWQAVTPGQSHSLSTSRSRPAWMLESPQRLTACDGRPWFEGALRLISGPERIETGWWDGADVSRDYYVAGNAAGMRLWIYRERRPPRSWYLHGMFG
ncbi:MAG: DNA polymerase Y family protein [Pseudomonadota bacterium]